MIIYVSTEYIITHLYMIYYYIHISMCMCVRSPPTHIYRKRLVLILDNINIS